MDAIEIRDKAMLDEVRNSQLNHLIDTAKQLNISKESDYVMACEIYKQIPHYKKQFETLELHKKQAYATYKQASELYTMAVGKLEEAETIIKGKLAEYCDSRKTDPEASGISLRDDWYVEITDKMAFVKGVSEGRIPLNLLDINEKELNKMAKSFKDMLKLDGIAVKKSTIVVRLGSKKS